MRSSASTPLLLAALLGSSGAACRAAYALDATSPRPSRALPDAASSASRCGTDPRAPWLAARDRECAADADCLVAVGTGCEFLAPSSRGAARPEYAQHHCMGWPGQSQQTALRCQCAVPGTERRCAAGCCQWRFLGSTGAWLP